MIDRLGFIGFGEVTCCLLRGISDLSSGLNAFVYDIDRSLACDRAKQFYGVKVCDSMNELLAYCDNVIVAIPGKVDKEMFVTLCGGEIDRHLFMDLSTALPAQKKEIAELVSQKGASYVDVAVMGSVPKLLQKTPMIISGEKTDAVIRILKPLGFDLTACGSEVGAASTIKLCRSIFMKGLPALFLETKRTCEKYNVSDQVFSSIYHNMADQDMDTFFHRLLDGAYRHTKRQMEELQECIAMEETIGVSPVMTSAAASVFASINEEKNNGK